MATITGNRVGSFVRPSRLRFRSSREQRLLLPSIYTEYYSAIGSMPGVLQDQRAHLVCTRYLVCIGKAFDRRKQQRGPWQQEAFQHIMVNQGQKECQGLSI